MALSTFEQGLVLAAVYAVKPGNNLLLIPRSCNGQSSSACFVGGFKRAKTYRTASSPSYASEKLDSVGLVNIIPFCESPIAVGFCEDPV